MEIEYLNNIKRNNANKLNENLFASHRCLEILFKYIFFFLLHILTIIIAIIVNMLICTYTKLDNFPCDQSISEQTEKKKKNE